MPTLPKPLAHDDAGEGLPVVLLHGLTFDRRSWRPIVERLGGQVRTVALDLPAHGETPGPPLGLAALAAAVRSTLETLDVERPVVVGHSMSGGLAMQYAATHPARGAVTIDQGPEVRAFARLALELAPRLRGDGFAAVWDHVFEASMQLDLLPEDTQALLAAGRTIERDVVLAAWEELLRSDPDAVQARIDRSLDALDVPVLAVLAREPAPGAAERMARLRDGAWEVWPSGGHFPHLAEPDRFARRLLEFVEHCREQDVLRRSMSQV